MNSYSLQNTILFIFLLKCSLLVCQVPAPGGLTVTSTRCGEINLAWHRYPIQSENSFIIIERSSEGNNGLFQQIASVPSTDSTYIDIDYTLVPNINYFYKIYWTNYESNSVYSNIISISFLCLPPTGFKILSTSCDKIQFSVDEYSSGTSFWGYNLYRSDNGINGYYQILGLPFRDTLLIDPGYFSELGKTYFYKLSAVRYNNPEIFSNEIVSAEFHCPPINDLSITKTYCSRIDLGWTPNHHDNARPLNIYRSSNGPLGNFELLNSFWGFNIYNDSFVDRGFEYHYKVQYMGETEFSNIVTSTVNCTTPTDFSVTTTACNQTKLIWYYNAPFEQQLKIYRSATGSNGSYQLLTTVPASVTNFVDQSVDFSNGGIFHYKIQYENETTFSDIVMAKPIMNTLKSGSWTDPTVWSCGRIPTSNDFIIINQNHLITIENNITAQINDIENKGELQISAGSNLIFNRP